MGSPFQLALERRDLSGLRGCAKADLHVHAGVTSGDRAFLKARTGLDIPPVDGVLASMDDMHAWVRDQAGDRFDRMPGRLLGIEATFVQARRDGVTRLEAGEDVWGITLHSGSARAVWAMLRAAHARGAPRSSGSRSSGCPGTARCRPLSAGWPRSLSWAPSVRLEALSGPL